MEQKPKEIQLYLDFKDNKGSMNDIHEEMKEYLKDKKLNYLFIQFLRHHKDCLKIAGMELYRVDDTYVFPIRKERNEPTEEYMAYLIAGLKGFGIGNPHYSYAITVPLDSTEESVKTLILDSIATFSLFLKEEKATEQMD